MSPSVLQRPIRDAKRSLMNRITRRFEALKAQNRKALVTYVINGDPRPSVTLDTMHALVEKGVDVIELGIPFSDPMAEGPVIQLGHERALEHNTSLTGSLDIVKQFREKDQDTPIIFMGYANPIERMGYDEFAKSAAEAGVDGVLTVDLPPEEAQSFDAELKQVGLENIFLLAPTTTQKRIHQILSFASGFVYYVSLKGVTGAGNIDLDAVSDKVTMIKEKTQLPICVGFGIKDAASAKAIAEHSDGVVVGSVLVNKMGELAHESDETIIDAVSNIVSDIRVGLDA